MSYTRLTIAKSLPERDVLDAPGQPPSLLVLTELHQEVTRLRSQLVQNEARITELKRQALEDPATGVSNRRAFEATLGRAVADYRRYGRPSALLLVDLDDFKVVNDSLGHAAGDAVLAHVARTLVTGTRDSDVVARVGGDEFAVLVREASSHDVAPAVARLTWMVSRQPIAWEQSLICVTASIGSVAFDESPDTASLFALADARMYAEKRRRRRPRTRVTVRNEAANA